jgi:UDP-2,4-diacetamido-2,4,6-trideoxy-beta-L-altropyranose hydrolase
MQLGTLIIRADASVEIGTGHVMRCLALAQAWQDAGGTAIFALASSTPSLLARLSAEQFQYVCIPADAGSSEDAERTVELSRSHGADWIVLDGYAFAPEYQWQIKAGDAKLLCIDDNAEEAGEFHGDIVLNQNLHAREEMYSKREPKTRLLLGSRFAMLRREFKQWRDWHREIPPVARRALVVMGGSDPLDLSSRVLHALPSLDLDGLEIRLATGGSNPRISSLQQLCEKFPGYVRLEVDAAMPDLMAWADLAVAAAGSTCWELCMLGLPAIVIDAAQNQFAVARELSREKIAIHVPLPQATTQTLAEQIYSLAVNPELRKTMSQNAVALMDGRGAERVVAAMIAEGLTVRRVQAQDCRLLWNWANDSQTRAASFNSAWIPWAEHRHWLSHKLEDPDCVLLMLEHKQLGPIATVRFHPRGDFASEISLTISPKWRARGLAKYVLEKSVAVALERPALQQVHAFVKPGNKSSAHAFQRAGFLLAGRTQVDGSEALHFTLERSAREAPPLQAGEEVLCR